MTQSNDAPRWRRYIRFWRSDVPSDVAEEIQFHLAELTDVYRRLGYDADTARRMAADRFGDASRLGQTMRALATTRENTMRRTERLDALARDLRFALRQLQKRPVFTAAAILTLAVSIGANTAIFSAVNAVLLRPVQTHDIGRLLAIQENVPRIPLMNANLDPYEVRRFMDQTAVFQSVTGISTGGVILTGDGTAQRVVAARTLGSFFDLFGVQPAAGRLYRPAESASGAHRVAVLSPEFWQQLGGQQSIVGTRLTLSGESYEVVGVAARGFRYPRSAQLWVPYEITSAMETNRHRLIMTVVARLRDGAGPAQAQQALRNVQASVAADQVAGREFFFSSRSFVEATAGQMKPALLALVGAVGFVLLIACANVASLQLVHGVSRSRELAVRSAIGAERGTLVKQLLVENLALATLGGLLGVAMGQVILKTLAAAGAASMPVLASVTLDGRVLGFTAGATILAGLLFGIAPAMSAGRVDLQLALRDGARSLVGAGRGRLLQGSVVVQIALTLVLLFGSALMTRTLVSLLAQDPGFTAEHVSTVRLTAGGPAYSAPGALTTLFDRVLDRLGHAPGVESVGIVSGLPFTGGSNSSPFEIDGAPSDPGGPTRHANLIVVGGDYFRSMEIAVLRGRAFDATDDKGSTPVVIIDEQLAKQFFGDADPVGRRVSQGGPMATIVGVVRTIHQNELSDQAKATIYYPQHQRDWLSTMHVTVRSSLPLPAVTAMARNALAEIAPDVPVYEPRLMTERIDESLATRRLTMSVLVGLAGVSLLLAVFGLYGVISYVVSQRTAEFGIRIALGAAPHTVRGLVVRQGLTLCVAGVAIGILVAAAGTGALNALLYGVSARDPWTFIAVAAILVIVAAIATYAPARRATRVSPMEALRGN